MPKRPAINSSVIVIVVLFVASTARAQKVTVEFDQAANFANYKTSPSAAAS